MKESIKRAVQSFFNLINQGKIPYFVCVGLIFLGMVESFAGAYLGTYTSGAFGAEYKDMVAFLILILVIIFRPNGLLGEQVSQKA